VNGGGGEVHHESQPRERAAPLHAGGDVRFNRKRDRFSAFIAKRIW